MEIQNGNTKQHADIDQHMEMLKHRHVVGVVKFRNKLYVGSIDQHGQEDLLAYVFDNDNEMTQFNEFVRQRYNDYKREVKQC